MSSSMERFGQFFASLVKRRAACSDWWSCKNLGKRKQKVWAGARGLQVSPHISCTCEQVDKQIKCISATKGSDFGRSSLHTQMPPLRRTRWDSGRTWTSPAPAKEESSTPVARWQQWQLMWLQRAAPEPVICFFWPAEHTRVRNFSQHVDDRRQPLRAQHSDKRTRFLDAKLATLGSLSCDYLATHAWTLQADTINCFVGQSIKKKAWKNCVEWRPGLNRCGWIWTVQKGTILWIRLNESQKQYSAHHHRQIHKSRSLSEPISLTRWCKSSATGNAMAPGN